MDLVDTPSPEAHREEVDVPPFPLDQLPLEIVHHLVRCCDERPTSSSFPCGPSEDLLNLSATNVFFYNHCRPRIWRSIAHKGQTKASPRTEEWLQMRSLEGLLSIMQDSNVVGVRSGQGAAEELVAPLPIKAFSYTLNERATASREAAAALGAEMDALIRVIEHLKRSKVQVLFLRGSGLHEINETQSKMVLQAILDLDTLSALRLNQMYFRGDFTMWLAQAAPLPKLRTLQVMHGHDQLDQLVRLAPNLHSLLLWTHARRFTGSGSSLGLPDMDKVIVSKLPTLRLLSLDAVHDSELIALVAETIKALHASGTTVPLEELFLEGRQSTSDRAELLRSLGLVPTLRRLALYHLRNVKPSLLYDIHDVAPQLEALTLVNGNTSRPSVWPGPLPDYSRALARFTKLSFFAWDRESPRVLETGVRKRPLELEYDTLSHLGQVVPTLTEAVAITQDVSEGSEGYFANFQRQGSSVRVTVRKHRATDFLVGFERWCVIAED